MTDLQTNPAIIKLIEYAKKKKSVTYEEVNDFLPENIVNSDRIEEVISLLEKNSIRMEEEEVGVDIEELPQVPTGKKKLVYDEKESAVDDPIRLYLREIGKENLLTAEQEVILSKQMEDGENIIRNVIKNAGLLVMELYKLAQRANARVDPKELNLSKKEISEFLAERRRINQLYREVLRPYYLDMRQFSDLKKKTESEDKTIIKNEELRIKK